jgi:ABC-type phosphate transport system permease subunit
MMTAASLGPNASSAGLRRADRLPGGGARRLAWRSALLAVLVGHRVRRRRRASPGSSSRAPRHAAPSAGICRRIVGSRYADGAHRVMALPVGVGAATTSRSTAAASRLTRFIELNIANLAGVPSIIYGLLGLEVFVRTWPWAAASSPAPPRSRCWSCR